MENKKMRKRFGLADYLEEERFLQEQHQKGWKMVRFKLPFSTYVFEKCEPEEYVYQLDFKEDSKDVEEYLQLFEDCGWEYFYQMNRWYYFRKPKSETVEENTIFSDGPSRAEMAKKIIRFQGIVSTLLIFPLLNFVRILINRKTTVNSFSGVLLIVVVIFMVLFAGIQFYNVVKLNRKIKNEKQI